MKESTLHSLVTARALLDHARTLIEAGSVHAATAGVILLQDAVELVLLAAMGERDIDDEARSEKMTFDQLIGSLLAGGIRVPKSGTLKAMNRQRVLAKHYGQPVVPETARGLLVASQTAIDSVLEQVVGSGLINIVLTDLLSECEAKTYLRQASQQIDGRDYVGALTSIRMALFVEVEQDYSVHGHRNGWSVFAGGWKAPAHTKSKEWIAAQIREPTAYVQIDAEKLRTDALEWGVNIFDLHNLRRLTPEVFRAAVGDAWLVAVDMGFAETHGTLQNAQYCLDRAVELVRKKQMHLKAIQPWVPLGGFQPPQLFLNEPIYRSADTNSEVVHVVAEGYLYSVNRRCVGFDGTTRFLGVNAYPENADERTGNSIAGYLVDLPGRPDFVPAPTDPVA